MSLSLRSARRFVFVVCYALAVAATVQAVEIRKWTDLSGRFELSAKFVSLEDGKVILARENGEKLTIPLEKLSKADQEYVATLKSESPFQPAGDSPFMPVPEKPARKPSGGEVRTVTVDWSESQLVSLEGAEPQWKITPPPVVDFDVRPKTVALPPKLDFFEKMTGMAINVAAKKGVVGYCLEKHGAEASSRILICDLQRGRVLATGAGPGQMAPLALHDDGEHVVMRRNEFGFGNLDRLEIWSIDGKDVVRTLVWKPYEDVQGGPRDVMWAEFVDATTLATSSRGGKVALWNVATAQPICHFQLSEGSVPSLSADRKWIAFSSSDRMGLFNIEKREVAVSQPTPNPLQWPYVAFSPSGRKIGCIAFNRILVWDTATGQLEKNFVPQGIHIHGAIDFPDDGFILCANQFLVALDTQIKLWQYSGAEYVRTIGGTTFFALPGFNTPGVFAAGELPHQQAISVLEKAVKQSDLFVFHSGTPVKLNVAGIADPFKAQVTAALTKKLNERKCPIQADAAIEVVASVEGPKQKEVSFWHSGDYKMNEYRTWLKFVYQGKPVWEFSGTNVPGFVMLKRGENIEGFLRKAGEKPSYEFYDNIVLPEFLQKPSDSQHPGGGQTLGTTQVSG